MTTVGCVGLAVRDVVFAVSPLPDGPGKRLATDRVEVGGGPAANAAVTIASLGGDARFVGAVGDDRLGIDLVAELATAGVDVSTVRVVSGVPSPMSFAAVDNAGERAIVNHTDPALFSGAAPVSDADLAGADAVLADVRWPEAAVAALRWAHRSRVPGVLDFDLGSSAADDLLTAASHVVFAAPALGRLAGEDDPAAGLAVVAARTDAWVAVTAGDGGAYWMEDGAVRHLPAFTVEVVDTLGAGDVFHGAFALSIAAETGQIEEAIRFASAAAAVSCTSFGGRTGIPTADEVAALLGDHT